MGIWTFSQARIIGFYQFGWNREMPYRLLLPEMEIMLVLWNDLSTWQRIPRFEKKTCNPFPPKVQTRRFFSQCNLFTAVTNHHAVQECLKHRLQISQWIQTLESCEIQFSSLSLKTWWNLECKPQSGTRKKATSSMSPFSSERWNIRLQSDPETDLLNYHVGPPALGISPWSEARTRRRKKW